MAYMDGKAAGRENPASDRVAPAAAPTKESNQEKTQPQTAKFRTYGRGEGASNQLRFDAGKGLSVAGKPSSVALVGKDKTFGAVENPSKK